MIDKHISDLLFEHDCIIVPEFGGFVANYAAAKVHPVEHTFLPPSKNIVFNKNLKTNDGLLANKIMRLNASISFSEANKLINRQVDAWNKELAKGGKVKIKDVGTLYRDVEHNIQFEPDRSVNYLMDAFGLSAFQSQPIKRDDYQFRVEKEFKDRVPVMPAIPRRINIKKYVKLAILTPVLAAAIWIPLKTDWLRNVNYSTLNPFAGKIKSEYTPRTTEAQTFHPVNTETEDFLSVVNDTASTVKISFVESGIEPLTVKLGTETVTSPAQSPDPGLRVPAAENFHIIAGCFQKLENAQRFISSLQTNQIPASIIGTNDAGLHMVGYGSFSTRREALDALAQIRASHDPNAWLLKK